MSVNNNIIIFTMTSTIYMSTSMLCIEDKYGINETLLCICNSFTYSIEMMNTDELQLLQIEQCTKSRSYTVYSTKVALCNISWFCLYCMCSARDWDGKDYLRIIPRVVW